MSAIIAILLGGLIFLALLGGEYVHIGWQVHLTSRTPRGWVYNRFSVDRQLFYHVPITQPIRSAPLFSPNERFAALDLGREDILFDFVENRMLIQLTGIASTWSPDSRYLALVDNDATSDTFQATLLLPIDEDGGVGEPLPISLSSGEALVGTILWSPQGDQLCFLADSEVGTHLLIANADGSNPRRITPTGRFVQAMEWSPDGTQIVFAWSLSEANTTISVMNTDGTGNTILAEAIPQNIANLSWSPDGRFIAYISALGNTLSVVDIETGETIGAPVYNVNASSVRWSGDGDSILFVSSWESHFYFVRSDGRSLRRATDTRNFYVMMP